MGLAQKEKTRILNELSESVEAVFLKAVDDETKMESHYKAEIATRRESIKTMQEQLHIDSHLVCRPVDVPLVSLISVAFKAT